MTPLKSFRSEICIPFTALVFFHVTILGVHSLSAQNAADDIFGLAEKSEKATLDDSLLKENPNIAQAHEIWKNRIEEATSTYLKKLETFLEREKRKGDLDFIKGMEATVEKAKNEHIVTSCLLFERLPPKVAPMLLEMNKAKSKANKAFIVFLEKEVADSVKTGELEKAKRIETFILASFLPRSMEFTFANTLRFENKIFLFVDQRMTWQSAYQWCRERNGDLAAIDRQEIQTRLYQVAQKRNQIGSRWLGGVKILQNWQWTDGTPFRYTAWAPSQPSGGRSETVLAFGYGPNGTWDDINPQKPYPFITQWTLY